MKQLGRLDVLNKANAGFLTVREAADVLGLSQRQVQRLKREVKKEGPAAILHKNTMRTPTHAIPSETKERILEIRKKAGYEKSNFMHFKELLEVNHGVTISYSALYRLLKSEQIDSPMTRRRFKAHRRRKRRAEAGSLLQMDASPYDWFGDGNQTDLHGAIDDATGQITGLYLCKNECMAGYHEVIRRTIDVFGAPEAVYADRHTIFRSPNADKAERIDSPKGTKVNETQFGRAMSELGIQVIAARSPQAKGRIERLWGTLQSRLPVEFELRGIRDFASANVFLESYRFAFNSEFAVEPETHETSFLPLDEGKNLDYILCVKEERVLDNGNVFAYKGKRLQIEACEEASWLPPKAKITVMVSPHIGIKASYKNYVFDTKPAPPKGEKMSVSKPRVEVEAKEKGEPWTPRDGLPWQPGLESYKECLEIVREIYSKPYATTGSGKKPPRTKKKKPA